MNCSKVNPNMWKGEECNGGTFGKNLRPTSTTAPQYKGKLYLAGIGWLWLSGWDRMGANGPFIGLLAQPMTDEQAMKFCPRSGTTESKSAARQPAMHGNGADDADSTIPF